MQWRIRLWAKYKLGELFQANDPETKQPATRNPFWKPKPGAYKVPGVGEILIGVNQLQASGVMFCVCDAAISVYSAVTAQSMNLKHEDVKKDFMTGILPGFNQCLQVYGHWAVHRKNSVRLYFCWIKLHLKTFNVPIQSGHFFI